MVRVLSATLAVVILTACSAARTPTPGAPLPLTGSLPDAWLMMISHDLERSFVEIEGLGGWAIAKNLRRGVTSMPGQTYRVILRDDDCRPLQTFTIGPGFWLLRIRDSVPMLTVEDDLEAGPGLINPGACQPPLAADWAEPHAYSFTYESGCGERNMLGTFEAQVEGGVVVGVKGLDDRSRQVVSTYRPSEFPTLAAMLEKVRQARNEADAGHVRLTPDPTLAQPVTNQIDWIANAIDDEECYTVSEFAPHTGGK